MPQAADAESALALCDCAIDLIGERGLRGASTRAVAERAGVSAALVNYRFGSRSGLVDAALDRVRIADGAAWAGRIERIRSQPPGAARLRPLLHAVLSDDFRSGRRLAAARWACLVETERTGAYAGPSAAFLDAGTGFWSIALDSAGADPSPAPVVGAALLSMGQALLISEPSLSVDAWLFDLVDRLADRLLGVEPRQPGDSPWRLEMEQVGEAAFVGEREHEPGTRSAIVNAAADIVLERGADSLTHRAVAEAAGVSLSSTTHHFSSAEEILTEACREVYRRARSRSVTATGPVAGFGMRDLREGMKATFANGGGSTRAEIAALHEIMLAISRAPAVRPIAVGLLAQKGRTSTHMLASLAGERRTDRMDGQVFAHLITGLILRLQTLPTPAAREAAIGQTMDAVAAFWMPT